MSAVVMAFRGIATLTLALVLSAALSCTPEEPPAPETPAPYPLAADDPGSEPVEEPVPDPVDVGYLDVNLHIEALPVVPEDSGMTFETLRSSRNELNLVTVDSPNPAPERLDVLFTPIPSFDFNGNPAVLRGAILRGNETLSEFAAVIDKHDPDDLPPLARVNALAGLAPADTETVLLHAKATAFFLPPGVRAGDIDPAAYTPPPGTDSTVRLSNPVRLNFAPPPGAPNLPGGES